MFAIAVLVFLVLVSILYLGIRSPQEEPIFIYTGFLISFSILVYFFGWVFYRNPSTSATAFPMPITNTNLVSVIIPIYNQQGMIESVIDAILNSSYKNIEIIAVNDGSTDGTKEALDKYIMRYHPSNLKVIHKKNEGKRKAVASGFFESSGKYIVVIDSDSVIDAKAIEEFIKTFYSNPNIGAVVGHAKLLNSHKNFLTKCQDAWYDYEFNMYKTFESYFGTVTCCCGCLAGYRREAIEDFMLFWHETPIPIPNGHNKKALLVQLPSLSKLPAGRVLSSRFLILSLFNKLMKSMANYDDSEDRALTSYSLIRWESAYVSSAIVYTEAPEDLGGFMRQQLRWKKGHIRGNLFVSTYFSLRNKLCNLPMSLIFYIGFGMIFVSPIIVVATLTYGIFILNHLWPPIFLALGFLSIGFLEGLDYRIRDSNAKYWMYRPVMSIIQSFIVSWLVYWAIVNYRKNKWLTR